eukprot:TRINITY_DN7915_c0_g1_i1.p1 TRINITY_DN7915_c0_g1~~TRINITY_DN7915_c0_g1_i1.p1  ORF type:complete len:109 (-),score=35.55 TRINITY_DN7915_c0_g1_i1:61-387(-)
MTLLIIKEFFEEQHKNESVEERVSRTMERRPIQRRKKRENAIILPRRDDFLEDDMEEESKEMEEKNELVTIPTQKASKSLTDLITGSEEIDERKLAERPEFGLSLIHI